MISFDAMSPHNNYLYNGKELIDDYGWNLYNYGARYYDAQVGRWGVRDNYTLKFLSNSPYNYVNANPIKYKDIGGEYAVIDDLAAMGIGGVINLGVAVYEGKVESFGQGAAYFAVGAISGEMFLYPEFGGFAFGGAFLAAGNNSIEIYKNNSKGNPTISNEELTKRIVIGALSGEVGGRVFQYVGPRVGASFSKIINMQLFSAIRQFFNRTPKIIPEPLIPGELSEVAINELQCRASTAAEGVVNYSNVLNSASSAYKGSTVLGHALSKHAGRNPSIWGKLVGNPSTWHNQALKHFDDIMNAPGGFIKTTTQQGINF